ncbi:MAG: 50S ribosomal protein L18 [Chitinophagales bacterium]
MLTKKVKRRNKIRSRIRKKITGTADIPRLSVYRSNKHIYAQIINDELGHTLVAASSKEDKDVDLKAPKKDAALKVGEILGAKATEAGIENVVFDRGGYLYHGRVKALADGARKGGLKF